MLKDALQFLANLNAGRKPVFVDVAGQPYAVTEAETLGTPIRPLPPQAYPETLRLQTLTGLVDAYLASIDNLSRSSVGIHLVSTRKVRIVGLHSDHFGHRHIYAEAEHVPEFEFPFGKFHEPESFLLALRTGFLCDEEALKVQQLCSRLTGGNEIAVEDDGVSQQVVLRMGGVTRASVALPSEGVPLIAWRTFREVPPVRSRFLLRMRSAKDGVPTVALFEIDARWQLDTLSAMRAWLVKELPEGTVFLG